MMTARVGTMYTISPQVIDGLYSSEADLWSVGVIAYMLLSSTQPFDATKRREMALLIKSGRYRPMNSKLWKEVTEDAKDFIRNTLVVDPRKRMTASEALEHRWILGSYSLRDSNTLISGDDLENPDDAMDSFERYKNTSKLKKLGLMVIAHQSTRQDILELRDAFKKYDTNRDGTLSFAEFKAGIEEIGTYQDDRIREIFDCIDVSHAGVITYTEFLAATMETHGHITEDRIAEAFHRLDCDDSGYISRQNLENIVGHEMTNSEFQEVISEADENGDGQISYQEFLQAFRITVMNHSTELAL